MCIFVSPVKTLNSAYYHRWYLMQEDGAMGSNIGHRGFNDRNLYVAENTRPVCHPHFF